MLNAGAVGSSVWTLACVVLAKGPLKVSNDSMAFGYWRESFAMELLPCLRWSTHRWWLPLDGLTAHIVDPVLLGVEPHRSSPGHFGLVQERLVRDPAFLIFVALRYLESRSLPLASSPTEPSVTVS